MIDGERSAGTVCGFGGGRKCTDGTGGADGGGTRACDVGQRRTGHPFGDDDATRRSTHDVENTRDASGADLAQSQSAGENALGAGIACARLISALGRRCELLGVDEGQADLAVEVDVLCAPELEATGAAVGVEEAVTTAGDSRAGDETRSAAHGRAEFLGTVGIGGWSAGL